jgi:hypothetical protein
MAWLARKIGSDPAVACNATGGKWGSAANRCVTRACYAAHDCGYWVHPEEWRDRVKLGDDIATVVFWFGEPMRIDGDTYYWAIGAGGRPYRTFSATFRGGHLAALGPIVMGNEPQSTR